MLVGDNEAVHAGQVLARIDDRDFKVALQQADAGVAATRAAVATRLAALAAQQSQIDAARATIAADEADATFAEQEEKRYRELAATGSGGRRGSYGGDAPVLVFQPLSGYMRGKGTRACLE